MGSSAYVNPPLATAVSPGAESVEHFNAVEQVINAANLTLRDKLDYETLTLLGGDGADYSQFFDDFDSLVYVSGTYPDSTVLVKPSWGSMAPSFYVGTNGPSAVKFFGSGRTDLFNYGFMWSLATQKFRFSSRVKWATNGGSIGGASLFLNGVTAGFGFGLREGGDRTHIAYWTQAGGSAVNLFSLDNNWHQVDVISVGDGNIKIRFDGGSWIVVPFAYLPSQSVELDLRSYDNDNMTIDWIYCLSQRPL
jgi:hypothetical protein